ncbi:MAG: type II toxin-antitoxin system HicB family antitoxin [Spirochaetes bacterium]|nr:type II toxin-antitoxin system HicB family antitoxin [Spirochaetota bacterium]
MKSIKYVLYKEDKYYVVQCINIELSTFGDTINNAVRNLDEALALYFEDNKEVLEPISIENVMLGEKTVNV